MFNFIGCLSNITHSFHPSLLIHFTASLKARKRKCSHSPYSHRALFNLQHRFLRAFNLLLEVWQPCAGSSQVSRQKCCGVVTLHWKDNLGFKDDSKMAIWVWFLMAVHLYESLCVKEGISYKIYQNIGKPNWNACCQLLLVLNLTHIQLSLMSLSFLI